MRINIHAGHNPDGKIACGACGIINESTANREVVKELKDILTKAGHTVYDCTVDNGTSQRDVLEAIVAKCNSHEVDVDISIHHNSGAADMAGDGKTTGSETWYWHTSQKAKTFAQSVQNAMVCETGYRSRGIKASDSLYVLKYTKAPAILVECCFVDDRDDIANYSARRIALGIAKGLDSTVQAEAPAQPEGEGGTFYKVQVGAFKKKEYAQALADEIKGAGYDAFIQEY